MPQTTPYPVKYLLIDDDGELESYELPMGVDDKTTIGDIIAVYDLDTQESSSPDAWLLTLSIKNGRPCIEKHEGIWLPDYDPDTYTDFDDEPETTEGEIPGPDDYEETFGL